MFAAALWALASSLLFVAANAMVKAIGTALPSAEVSLFRAAGGLLLLVLAWRELHNLRRLADPKWHLIRSTLGAVTMVCLMHAFATLPMALATSLYYARVLLMIPLAGLLLGERSGWDLWAAAIIGFIGVGIATGPIFDAATLSTGVVALLIAIVASSGSQVAVTRLTRSNPPSVIVSVFALVALAILTIPAASSWISPAPGEVAILIGLGLAGAMAQYAVTRAYALAGASRIAPISYVEIPLAAAIGWIMAREIPTAHQAIGAGLVVASTAYVSLARRPAQAPQADDQTGRALRTLHPAGSGDADHG